MTRIEELKNNMIAGFDQLFLCSIVDKDNIYIDSRTHCTHWKVISVTLSCIHVSTVRKKLMKNSSMKYETLGFTLKWHSVGGVP